MLKTTAHHISALLRKKLLRQEKQHCCVPPTISSFLNCLELTFKVVTASKCQVFQTRADYHRQCFCHWDNNSKCRQHNDEQLQQDNDTVLGVNSPAQHYNLGMQSRLDNTFPYFKIIKHFVPAGLDLFLLWLRFFLLATCSAAANFRSRQQSKDFPFEANPNTGMMMRRGDRSEKQFFLICQLG